MNAKMGASNGNEQNSRRVYRKLHFLQNYFYFIEIEKLDILCYQEMLFCQIYLTNLMKALTDEISWVDCLVFL
jgi:hypothetical protein